MDIIEEYKKLKINEKIYFIHIIFDLWEKGNIKKDDIFFLPEDIKIYNSYNTSKVYKYLSNIEINDKIKLIKERFLNLKFYEKLDFMIFMFEYLYSDKIISKRILTNISDNINFLDLSNEILKYKLNFK